MMGEIDAEQPNGIPNIRMILRAQGNPDPRRFNSHTADKIGVLIVGGEDKSRLRPSNRDIVMHLRGREGANRLERINKLNQRYDPLQYVLMYPHGDLGWNINIKNYDPDAIQEDEQPDNGEDRNQAEITVMQYYSSRLMVRVDPDSGLPTAPQLSLHSFGKLFHQYIVDQYAK
ncbi:hypothetical protein, partial, partial [Parasitella parasitica]